MAITIVVQKLEVQLIKTSMDSFLVYDIHVDPKKRASSLMFESTTTRSLSRASNWFIHYLYIKKEIHKIN